MKMKRWLLMVIFCLAATAVIWWVRYRGDDAPPKAVHAEATSDKAGLQDAASVAKVSRGADDFVGTSECRSCHAEFYEKWSSSWHGLAMQPYTEQFARQNLKPSSAGIAIRGHTYQAKIGGPEDAIMETGPDGPKTYPIQHVLGGKNVYYFLTPFRGGRLQVLPLAFDSRKKEWYDTTGSMVRHFIGRRDDAIEWTDRLLTFNAVCQGCHVSQVSKNYAIETDTYQTTWREPGINCESCHGPGRKHVDRMTARTTKDRPAPDSLAIIVTGGFSPDQMNSLCAQCHAKASPLTASFPPGERFFDHFRLGTLEDLDFFPDGRDLGENFTLTSYMMSPCIGTNRLECSHCHTSSGRNKHTGVDADRACAPCHQKHFADPAAHSHHKASSDGSRCVACHMPETDFARMRRHDHSMLPPVPAASVKFQSPNACNLCHKDHDAQWADEWVRKWYPRDYQASLVHRAELIEAARKNDWKRLDEMVAYVTSPAKADGGKAKNIARNEVFAASLLRLMDRTQDKRKWPAYLTALGDPSPLVRASAAAGLAACPERAATRALAAAASDSYRLVRIEAAVALARRPVESLDPGAVAAVQKALEEYEVSLRARPDDPLSHYNLGNAYQDRGDPPAALAEFQIALRLDPALVPALVNLSMVHARLGQTEKAEAVLRQALRHQPASIEANFNLGLLLAELNRPAEAEACLRTAFKADPQFAQAAYNLAVLAASRDLKEAIALCRKAAELRPEEPRNAYTLALYLRQSGDKDGAIAVLKQLIERHPDHKDAVELLRSIR